MSYVEGSNHSRITLRRRARVISVPLFSVGVIAGASAITLNLMTTSTHGATTPGPVSGITGTIDQLQHSAQSIDCGSWGDSSNANSSASALLATSGLSGTHASLLQCGFSGKSWVMLFQPAGSASSPGTAIFEISHCAVTSQSCANPATKPALSSWKVTKAPVAGTPTLIGNPYPGTLIFDISGNQLILDTSSGAWISGDSMAPCAVAWGKTSTSKSGLTADPVEQEAFLQSNPSCN